MPKSALSKHIEEIYIPMSCRPGTLGKKPNVPLQKSNLRPSDYKFGSSTTELWETCKTYLSVQNTHLLNTFIRI